MEQQEVLEGDVRTAARGARCAASISTAAPIAVSSCAIALIA